MQILPKVRTILRQCNKLEIIYFLEQRNSVTRQNNQNIKSDMDKPRRKQNKLKLEHPNLNFN